jgi:hypothetical protein
MATSFGRYTLILALFAEMIPPPVFGAGYLLRLFCRARRGPGRWMPIMRAACIARDRVGAFRTAHISGRDGRSGVRSPWDRGFITG